MANWFKDAVIYQIYPQSFYDTNAVSSLSTSGGFLRSGNITLMTGVEEERVDELIEIIGKCSSKRKQMVQPNPMYGNELYVSAPMEITVGGATVFVLDVDKFYKL